MSELARIEKHDSVTSQRQEKLSSALNYYARKITFTNRSRRNLYELAGIAPRRRDRFFFWAIWAIIFCSFLLPFLASVIYFTFLITPQFESETKFVLRSAAPLLTGDRFSPNQAEPKQKIIQDTQVVESYIGSMAVIDDLQKHINFDEIYGHDGIDIISRLDDESTREDILDYWEDMYSSWISPKSGIVTLKVRSFSPEEAQNVLVHVMNLAEERVNHLNAGIWDSLESAASRDLEFATQKLEEIRLNLREQQVSSGILNVDRSAESLSDIISDVEKELASQKVQQKVFSESVAPDTPLLLEANRRIAALEIELQELKSRATARQETQEKNLAAVSIDFRQLELQLEIAEERFSDAVEEFEKTKLLKSLQLVYLDQFTEPTLPQDFKYPKILKSIFFSFLIHLIVCTVLLSVLIMLRRKID